MPTINLQLLYLAVGASSCLTMLLLLYNVVAAVLFLRESDRAEATGLAKVAWALGVAALLTWPFPCLGGVFGLAAVVTARVERHRIFRGESSIAGSTPTRMGQFDGGVAVAIQVALVGSLIVGGLMGAPSSTEVLVAPTP